MAEDSHKKGELSLLLEHQRELREQLQQCEKLIFDKESEYLESTDYGNIVRGWDGYIDRYTCCTAKHAPTSHTHACTHTAATVSCLGCETLRAASSLLWPRSPPSHPRLVPFTAQQTAAGHCDEARQGVGQRSDILPLVGDFCCGGPGAC
jgi:hypothetical protein